MLVPLAPTDKKFTDVEKQFSTQTKGGIANAKVLFMAAIVPCKQMVQKYDQYKVSLGAAANEKRLWHGTKCPCNFANTRTLCTNVNCALCSIIQSGLQLKFAAKGSWGAGLYHGTSPVKSHGYNSGSQAAGPNGENLRVMLLNRVIVGTTASTVPPSGAITAPPAGHHSVTGGGTEVIVYREDATIPSYVIVYSF